MTKLKIYADYNATTPVHPDVQNVMRKKMASFGNPSSGYAIGRASQNDVLEARDQIADLLDAPSDQLIFTASASEANNWVLQASVLPYLLKRVPVHIIVSNIEHPSIRETARFWESQGVQVSWLPVDGFGQINPDHLGAIIQPNTRLISVMMANNEVGTLQPVSEMISIAQEKKIPIHIDAVQAIGKMPVSVRKLHPDFLTFSAHKWYGPKGVGGVVIRDKQAITPLIYGGSQEQQLRAGTENLLGIIGAGCAAVCVKKEWEQDAERVGRLTQLFWNRVKVQIENVELNGHPTERLANTVNMSFKGVKGEALMRNLDLQGVAISTGSACSTGSIEPSETLLAMGFPPQRVLEAVRFSFGKWTTEDDINHLVQALAKGVKELRLR